PKQPPSQIFPGGKSSRTRNCKSLSARPLRRITIFSWRPSAWVPAVHAGFENVGPELCNAGTDSKHLEELTTCNPGGSDSPKLRTASARSGGAYFDRSWMVSSVFRSAIKRE